jgi:hypothetical protein
MSRASRQRQRKPQPPKHNGKFHWLFLFVVFFAAAGLFGWIYFQHTTKKKAAAVVVHDLAKIRTLKELLALSPAELEKCDVGLMSLICADGLPGSENLDIDDCLKKLEGLAAKAKFDTDRHYYRFREHPEQFRNSFGYYQMMLLEQVLVKDLGIEYNPELRDYLQEGKAPTYGVFNSDSKNIFIHGLLNGSHYGTCASMPVLLAAVARRLDYPVNLAGTKFHWYVRYEDYNNKHFNIEPTVTEGFLTPSDEEYKTDQFACTEEEIKEHGWLRPYSHAEILSEFLSHRSVCLSMIKHYQAATEMIFKAQTYAPDTTVMRKHFENMLEKIKNAPLGDKIHDWQEDVGGWEVPRGSRSSYYENRKTQIRYFVGVCPNVVASQRAMDDLKNELGEYARQLTLTNPAPEFLETGQNSLEFENFKTHQTVKIPIECLPPPLDHGDAPRDYLHTLKDLDFSDEGKVLETFWRHYRDVTTDWSNQPPLLPQNGRSIDMNFPVSPLTGQ